MADAPHSKCGGKPCRFKSDRRYQQETAERNGSAVSYMIYKGSTERFAFIRLADSKSPLKSGLLKLYICKAGIYTILNEKMTIFAFSRMGVWGKPPFSASKRVVSSNLSFLNEIGINQRFPKRHFEPNHFGKPVPCPLIYRDAICPKSKSSPLRHFSTGWDQCFG